MSQATMRWGRKTAVFLLIVLLLGVTQAARAEGIILGDRVALGEEIEGDVILSGNDVRLSGVVDGDVFAVGRTVIVDGRVSGSLFVVGDKVIINGEVGGSVYLASVSAQVGGTAVLNRSLYFLGLNLLTERGSNVARDLYALTFSARLGGSVQRDTQAVIGLIEVVRFVLNMLNRVTTSQPVSFLEPGLTIDTRGRGTMYRVQAQAEPVNPQLVALGDWLARNGRLLINYLIVGILMLWLRPAWLQKWSGQVGKRPLPTAGSGLAVYVIGFTGALVLLLVLFAVGAGMGLATLWGLAFTWWGISLSALSLGFWIFILFVSYLSKVIVAAWFGGWLLNRVFPDTDGPRRFGPLLVGLVLFVLLASIPYAGWALSMIVTFIGLGAAASAYLEIRIKRTGTAVEGK
ncbi:MAG: polymer-forming cytoskeletal protein [Chloroflexi bacterium]|nr:polymer-forming cytoskeletal protein [Chloroflexota bacterium]